MFWKKTGITFLLAKKNPPRPKLPVVFHSVRANLLEVVWVLGFIWLWFAEWRIHQTCNYITFAFTFNYKGNLTSMLNHKQSAQNSRLQKRCLLDWGWLFVTPVSSHHRHTFFQKNTASLLRVAGNLAFKTKLGQFEDGVRKPCDVVHVQENLARNADAQRGHPCARERKTKIRSATSPKSRTK